MRSTPSPQDLLALLQASIEPEVAGWVGGSALLSMIVTIARSRWPSIVPTLPTVPLLLLGLGVLGIAALRLAAMHQRGRESRMILAGLLAASRSLARQALAQLGPTDIDMAQGIAWRCIGFAHAMHDHLEAVPLSEATLTALAPAEGVAAAGRSNPPNIILATMSREIATAYQRARISAQALQTLEDRVVELSQALSAAERLKAAPVEAAYGVLLHRLVIAFGVLLPFGGAAEPGLWTPLLVAVLVYMAFGLEALCDHVEPPRLTGIDPGSLESVSRSVEISIRDMLGEAHLPPDREGPPATAD